MYFFSPLIWQNDVTSWRCSVKRFCSVLFSLRPVITSSRAESRRIRRGGRSGNTFRMSISHTHSHPLLHLLLPVHLLESRKKPENREKPRIKTSRLSGIKLLVFFSQCLIPHARNSPWISFQSDCVNIPNVYGAVYLIVFLRDYLVAVLSEASYWNMYEPYFPNSTKALNFNVNIYSSRFCVMSGVVILSVKDHHNSSVRASQASRWRSQFILLTVW